jgi:ATP-dependent DNA helicase RecG
VERLPAVSASDFLRQPLRYVKGVGPRRAADLQRVGLQTVEDLLHRFPIRYEDRGHLRPIATLQPAETASVAGEVIGSGLRATRRPGFRIFEALVRDSSGTVRAVWLNQPFLRDVIQRGQRVILFGTVERHGGGLQLTNPQYEILPSESEGEAPGEETIHTGRIVPIYERVGTLTPKMQRRLVHDVLERLPEAIEDPLPRDLLDALALPERRSALIEAHFPTGQSALTLLNRFRTPAQLRLIFEEFFLFQVGLILKRRSRSGERKARVCIVDDRIRAAARRVLPFSLTGDQKRALKEIVDDLQRPQPMSRLLQGDVGAGKTIVALLAAVVAMENGLQVAFMAPTEILAEQHALTIRRLLAGSRFRVVALTGSLTPVARRAVLQELGSGAAHLVVGTHALVQDPVAFDALGLVIIDEQHRFGVLQRAGLRAKGLNPDVLVMTATPIPRSLALTTYGDLDVSVIRELPPGRKPTKTVVKPDSRRGEVHRFVREQLAQGRQAYIVYPLVEESEKVDLKAATAMADHLAAEVFPEYRVGLLHGRLKPDTKDEVMEAFVQGRLDVLVATTVVEVGVDVANASVMVVEHAERFGLAQLHQLRGRVGRGGHQAFCVFLYQAPLTQQARARLEALAETSDGFVLADRDLELRGPGDFFGTRQSGMPTLRIGDVLRDHAVMEDARREAVAWLDRTASGDPVLALVRGTWEQRFGLVGVG